MYCTYIRTGHHHPWVRSHPLHKLGISPGGMMGDDDPVKFLGSIIIKSLEGVIWIAQLG